MNGNPWTSAELKKLKRHYPDMPTMKLAGLLRRPVCSVYTKASALGIKKSEGYLYSPHACRLRRGDNVGAAHRFLPGHVPANKGVKGWDAGGRSHETRFKKGQRSLTWMPIGSERINADGYRDRKVADTGYPPHDWKAVHTLLWIEHYGPVPPGYAVGFIDGNKQHVAINNLVLLSRGDLMRRNMIHNYPPEVKQVIRLVWKLNRMISRVTDERRNPGSP